MPEFSRTWPIDRVSLRSTPKNVGVSAQKNTRKGTMALTGMGDGIGDVTLAIHGLSVIVVRTAEEFTERIFRLSRPYYAMGIR